jgi:Nif-specific regulatory protein
MTTKQLERFLAATTAIAGAKEEKHILQAIITSAQEVIGASAASILLMDPNRESLRFAIATGPAGDKAILARVPVEGSVAGWVVKNRKALNLPTASADPRHFSGVDRITEQRTENLLCVPLMVGEQVIGAVQALNKEDGEEFTSEDLRFLETIAVQAAHSLQQADNRRRRKEELDELRRQMASKNVLIGREGGLKEIFEIVEKVANAKTTVLLRGETGTGKGMIARSIYEAGDRYNRSLVTVNCANLSEELLESELFGHVKGAFTGATANKAGRFKTADGGTIFLDEIGDISPRLQTKLLRVIQEQEFEPLGSNRTEKVNLRVIAATNRNLEQAIREGNFREDLYYRLSVVVIELPPLRERREDILTLVEHFLARYSRETNKRMFSVSPAALEVISGYEWPGNIRELENAIERAVVLGEGEVLEVEMLPRHIRGEEVAISVAGQTLAEAQRNFKRWFIAKELANHNGNQTSTARDLGIQRSYLNRLIKHLEIGNRTE